jgi:hypothetical protein
MNRSISQRLHDRLWTETSKRLTREMNLPGKSASAKTASSVSASMPWADLCEAFAGGKISSQNFRRCSATREIVETLGPVDAQFFVRKIKEWDASWLSAAAVKRIDQWGNPIRWPGILLGCPSPFSPSSLRYLAQALWLRRHGQLEEHSRIAEIGVGFGGLAAMNAIVSGAHTTLIDLPQVEQSAMRMLAENQLEAFARTSDSPSDQATRFVISNYAFTELNAELQELYFARYIRGSSHGMILSNASVFASIIGGLSNEQIVESLQQAGHRPRIETTSEILSSSDTHFGNVLIAW